MEITNLITNIIAVRPEAIAYTGNSCSATWMQCRYPAQHALARH